MTLSPTDFEILSWTCCPSLGTLLEAWASVTSFQPRDQKSRPPSDNPGNPTVNFRGEKRSNQTHESKTDPDALLARKGAGKEAKLSYNNRRQMLSLESHRAVLTDQEADDHAGAADRCDANETARNYGGGAESIQNQASRANQLGGTPKRRGN